MDVLLLAILLLVVGALVLLAARIGRERLAPERGQGPQYVWVAVIGPSNAESSEDTYKAAYLLLQAGLRMKLAMVETYAESGAVHNLGGTMNVVGRVAYSTEAFRPRKSRYSVDGRFRPLRALQGRPAAASVRAH